MDTMRLEIRHHRVWRSLEYFNTGASGVTLNHPRPPPLTYTIHHTYQMGTLLPQHALTFLSHFASVCHCWFLLYLRLPTVARTFPSFITLPPTTLPLPHPHTSPRHTTITSEATRTSHNHQKSCYNYQQRPYTRTSIPRSLLCLYLGSPLTGSLGSQRSSSSLWLLPFTDHSSLKSARYADIVVLALKSHGVNSDSQRVSARSAFTQPLDCLSGS